MSTPPLTIKPLFLSFASALRFTALVLLLGDLLIHYNAIFKHRKKINPSMLGFHCLPTVRCVASLHVVPLCFRTAQRERERERRTGTAVCRIQSAPHHVVAARRTAARRNHSTQIKPSRSNEYGNIKKAKIDRNIKKKLSQAL